MKEYNMTKTNNAEQKTKGNTLFGELKKLAVLTTKNGKTYIRAAVTVTRKNGDYMFTRQIVSFKEEAIAALKEAGNGAIVRVFGYTEKVEQEGGKYTVQMMRVVDARDMTEKRAAARAGGVSEETTSEETKVDNTEIPF